MLRKKVFFWVSVFMIFVMMTCAVFAAAPTFKIGVVTGTVSQNEDEYRGAEAAIRKYPGLIKHVTYPDNFMQEQETTIAQITGLAADRSVKAIVVNQAIPGTVAAIRKVKETRPDIIFIAGEPHEDPPMLERYADAALISNNRARGKSIVQLAKKMGAKKFLHYSFPRHMSYQQLAERRDIMRQECAKLGLEFIFVTAPDPMGEGGIPAAQQFILEDVPRQVAKHGKDIALFSTNCAMQEPLIAAALKTGAIVPEQCCPSPTHGYPGALGLEITQDMKGNFPKIAQEISKEIAKKGAAGRFATWPVATGYLNTTAGVELAKLAVEKKIKLSDIKAVQQTVEKNTGHKMQFERLSNKGNYYMYLVDSIVF
ncbi:MAG TPA: DUF3798 domain-containing protein [Bacillota bacterium]|nr:DUF3798 domain-containing protein [Bacillota bacterium]HPT86783.1 DUF3798 domain-containing protein [Bacillota bacterium]